VTRPRLLDLFCGAGGAAMGYARAGFEVVGVDVADQPHYPFEFRQADAMTFPLDGFDAIHASPPCQAFSIASKYKGTAHKHLDLLTPTRLRLQPVSVPWVIENVPGAPMRPDYLLCGCMFGLPGLRRERWFETSWHGFAMIPSHDHREPVITVAGHGPPSRVRSEARPVYVSDWRKAMGIDWMNRDELAQAIPPAYTEYVGRALAGVLAGTGASGDAAGLPAG
jgi:DNA (cytosine-5)-methyltransferase 1